MSEILKYFKEFATKTEYDTYINGSPILPNVSFVNMDVFYKDTPDYSSHYLAFKITSAGTINWYASNTGVTKQISYSRDNGTSWTEITSNTGSSAPSISVNAGDTIMFKGTNNTYGISNNNYSCFSGSTAGFEVEGNIMSLIYGDEFKNKTSFLSGSNYNFCNFFRNCTGLTSAENLILPATTLAQSCYQNMFRNCNSLVTVPALSATTLAVGCYAGMFQGCKSLTTAPELTVTTLAESCYANMFGGCTSLTTSPVLPATTLAIDCYDYMFNGCRSLTTAPELPATTLVESCYYGMFYECSSLNYIKCLATDISASECTEDWVEGVASTGTFVKAASMTSWTTGTGGIPSNWTVQDAA